MKFLELDVLPEEGTEEEELLGFVLDTTISQWAENLEGQQMLVAEDRTLSQEQAMDVAGNLHTNLQLLKVIRKRLDG
jgi:hypothetical protein